MRRGDGARYIARIPVSADRKVEGIDLHFDDSVNAYMISPAPSTTGTSSPIPGHDG